MAQVIILRQLLCECGVVQGGRRQRDHCQHRDEDRYNTPSHLKLAATFVLPAPYLYCVHALWMSRPRQCFIGLVFIGKTSIPDAAIRADPDSDWRMLAIRKFIISSPS